MDANSYGFMRSLVGLRRPASWWVARQIEDVHGAPWMPLDPYMVY